MSAADVVRLPGGRTMTRSRARALGLIDSNGEFTDKVPADSQAAKALERDRRAAEWRASQRLDEPVQRRTARKRKSAEGVEPETTSDGKIVRKKAPKPLVPKNVTKDGEVIEDEELLAKIAARTAAIEAGEEAPSLAKVIQDHEDFKAAEVVAPEGVDDLVDQALADIEADVDESS